MNNNEIDIEKLLQKMAQSIEFKSTKISLYTFADESAGSFDIYNHRNISEQYDVPRIPMQQYLTRFNKFLSSGYDDPELSIKILILGMNFIDRFIANNPGFELTDLNRHRLVCVAVLEANKILMDVCFNNEWFSRLGGLGSENNLINRLEGDFANKMQFKFKMDKEKFIFKAKSLGLNSDQVDKLLAIDANGMTPGEIVGEIPEARLSSTPSSTMPTPTNSSLKKPQNKVVGCMANLCSCFGYKNARTQDQQSQSSGSTNISSSNSRNSRERRPTNKS